ncbi:MAG: acyltransferase [Cetobacterium sp.]
MYLKFLNYFGGFAIFLIVVGHSFEVSGFFDSKIGILNPFYKKLIYAMVTGGTSLFIFISGFLFHHVFYTRGFNFKKFMENKYKNVFLPYSVIILPAIIIEFYKTISLNNFSVKFEDILRSILLYFSGTALSSTWYIPFSLLLFLASPIFIKYIELEQYKKRIIFLGLVVSIIIHRPIHDLTINVFQSLIYFSPIYCLGIYFSQNKETLIPKLNKNINWIGIIWLALVIYQAKFDKYTNSHKQMFNIKGIDIMIIQKLFLCLFLLGIFYKIQENGNVKFDKTFDILAKYSFPIFFIHNYFIEYIFPFFLKILNINLKLDIFGLFVLGAIVCISSILVSFTSSNFIKRINR